MKKIFATFAVLLTAALLTGCGEDNSSVPTEIIVDGSGTKEESTVFPVILADGTAIDHAPETAASLSPAATEIIAELGFGDKLCAVSRYCDFPENVCSVTAGSSENPDIDKLAELAPDVLFTLTPLSERERYTLENSGITVVELNSPETVSDYGALYGTVTTVFEGEEAGKAAAEKAEQELKKSAAECAFSGSYIYVTPKLTAAGSNTFENAVLSLCGRNVCTADGYSSAAEDISEAPEYIIASDTLTAADITGSELFGSYAADAKIVFVPSDRFERPSARINGIFTSLSNSETHSTAE